MMNKFISLNNVWAYFNDVCALENINLDIQRNDFITILGPNGAGKSTFINIILGIVKPDKGTIDIDRKKITFGYVPQYINFSRQTPVNVFDTVIMGRLGGRIKIFNRYTSFDIKRAFDVMRTMGIEKIREKHIGSLSGGQLQRVLIARALVNDPDVIILDEPFNGLDTASKEKNLEVLKSFFKKKTIILITHEIEDDFICSDKVMCLNKKIYYYGPADSNNIVIKDFCHYSKFLKHKK